MVIRSMGLGWSMKGRIPEWDESLCREAIRHCFPEVHVRNLRSIYGGWDNFVVDVNDEVIFRFPRRNDVERSVGREVGVLQLLQGALPCPIPSPEYVWHGDGKVPTAFFGYPKLPGTAPASHVAVSMQASLAGQVARFLNALQRFPITDHIKGYFPGNSVRMWKEGYASLLSQLRRRVALFDASVWERTLALFNDFLEDEDNFAFKPVLVHRDLNTNILYDNRRMEISGVIDWGDAAIGDPAFDFGGFLYSEGEGFVRRMLEGYQGRVDDLFWRRMEFYSKVIPYHVVLGAIVTGHHYLIEHDEVILGRGSTAPVFKMFKSSGAFEIRGSAKPHVKDGERGAGAPAR
jgi:aminoglycoside 2''-phosphotransferase